MSPSALPPLLSAAAPLLAGKVVIIPTDTIYGFSALADDFAPVGASLDAPVNRSNAEKIFAIKGRAETKPLIRLVPDAKTILRFAKQSIPHSILDLLPAPLTLIVKTAKNECGMESTAFRCPNDANLNILLQKTGMLYSTSVNKSGSPPLTSIEEMRREFGSLVAAIIENDTGEKSCSGAQSTIVDITGGTPRLVRQGAFMLP